MVTHRAILEGAAQRLLVTLFLYGLGAYKKHLQDHIQWDCSLIEEKYGQFKQYTNWMFKINRFRLLN